MIRGITLDGGLRDYYLAQQQITENKIEHLKVTIQVAAALGQVDAVNKQLKQLAELMGLASQKGEADGQWMDNPEKIKQSMEFLKNFKPKIQFG